MVRSSSRYRRASLVAIATGLALLAADLALGRWAVRDGLLGDRPLPPFGALPHPRQRAWLAAQRATLDQPPTGVGRFDPELGWRNEPGACEAGGRRCFDAIGARGRGERAPGPPPGVRRVACFGDSYTYGSDVDDGEDWPARLDALDPGLEVLNLGVGGYGTDQALLRFRREGPALGADVVLVGLLVENIGRNVNRYRPLYYPSTVACSAKPRFALNDDGELELVPLPYATRRELLEAVSSGRVLDDLAEHEYWRGDRPLVPGSTLARIAAAWSAYRRRQPEVLWSDPDGEPFRVTLAILENFEREARAAGASRVGVLVFPRARELADLARRGTPFWGTLLEALDARGVPWLDLAQALRARSGAAPPYTDGGHLDPEGNRIVAEAVHAWLAER